APGGGRDRVPQAVAPARRAGGLRGLLLRHGLLEGLARDIRVPEQLFPDVPEPLEAVGDVFHRELAGREVFVDLVPRDRHGDRRVGAGAERVRRDGGLAAGVLEVGDVDPRAAFVDRPFDGGDLWILGGHRGSDVPGEGGGGVVVDGPAGGDVDVEPARARRLDAAREAEFLHLLADADRGPHYVAEPGAGTRV